MDDTDDLTPIFPDPDRVQIYTPDQRVIMMYSHLGCSQLICGPEVW